MKFQKWKVHRGLLDELAKTDIYMKSLWTQISEAEDQVRLPL